jgi:hypothetical protein
MIERLIVYGVLDHGALKTRRLVRECTALLPDPVQAASFYPMMAKQMARTPTNKHAKKNCCRRHCLNSR